MAGVDKEFDYLVPDGVGNEVALGSQVRVDLHGRRIGGWVTEVGVEPTEGLALRPIAKVRGFGPQADVIELAGWAAWRWAGRRATFLKTASPDFAVPVLPAPRLRPPSRPAPSPLGADLPVDNPVILRLPPAADPTAAVAELAQRGPTLVVVPSQTRAAVLADRMRAAGAGTALLPGEWAQARAGAAVVIGTRAAAWAPCPGLSAAVVLDGHDEGLGQEQAPTWHATGVVAERARRAGVPCVIISSCPTLELLASGALRTIERSVERRGWAAIEVIDRRGDDPRHGLYSPRLVRLIRDEKRVLCLLNRTGRARLLACAACGSLARCERCGAALREGDAGLQCPRCGLQRPRVCAQCGSTSLRRLRIGVSRAREELEALAGRSVGEVTAATGELPAADILVGTEALLHRFGPGDGIGAVAFIDFDQELLAPRIRAGQEALALLAGASRIVRGRAGQVVVQTRQPDHAAVRAAVLADPSVWSDAELPVRADLSLPPYAAIAVISGPGAAEYVAGLAGGPLEVLGPDGDEWMVKAPTADVLADSLAAVARPAERLRVAVDPARL